MFDDDANATLYNEVTREEILEVLNSFKRDKFLGPDGWTVELLTHFFDISLGGRPSNGGRIKDQGLYPSSYKFDYIALIPKRRSTRSFLDYLSISLCNLIYKIISKIIVGRIKNTL